MAQALSKNIVNGVIGLMVVVALVLSYFYFKSPQAPGTEGIQTGAPIITVTVSPKVQQIIGRLNEIKAIQLDATIFSQNAFSALVDTTTIIPEESQGTENPFQKINF